MRSIRMRIDPLGAVGRPEGGPAAGTLRGGAECGDFPAVRTPARAFFFVYLHFCEDHKKPLDARFWIGL
jgi:hypothetical protein